MAVNSVGSVHDPASGKLIAGPRNQNGVMISAEEDLVNSRTTEKGIIASIPLWCNRHERSIDQRAGFSTRNKLP
ncbi:MAG: hypothetical protein CM1200mP3_02850 [Chloroflexota bacterium]|nr:MAG: hypothetical protein CM1200mP3_02850 [Chloroflexota bacterium]